MSTTIPRSSAIGVLLCVGSAFAQVAIPNHAREERLQKIQAIREKLAAKPRVEPADAEAAFVETLPELPADYWRIQTPSDAITCAWNYLNGGEIDPKVDSCAELLRTTTDNTQYVGAVITDRQCWRATLRGIVLIADGASGTPIARSDSRRDVDIWLEPTSGRLLKIHAVRPGEHESQFRELDRLDATRRISSSDREQWISVPETPTTDFCHAISSAGVNLSDEIVAVFVQRNTLMFDDEFVWSVECRTIPGPAPRGELREPQRCWRTVIGAKGIMNKSNGPGPRAAPKDYEKPMWWYLPHPPMDLPPRNPIPLERLTPVDR